MHKPLILLLGGFAFIGYSSSLLLTSPQPQTPPLSYPPIELSGHHQTASAPSEELLRSPALPEAPTALPSAAYRPTAAAIRSEDAPLEEPLPTAAALSTLASFAYEDGREAAALPVTIRAAQGGRILARTRTDAAGVVRVPAEALAGWQAPRSVGGPPQLLRLRLELPVPNPPEFLLGEEDFDLTTRLVPPLGSVALRFLDPNGTEVEASEARVRVLALQRLSSETPPLHRWARAVPEGDGEQLLIDFVPVGRYLSVVAELPFRPAATASIPGPTEQDQRVVLDIAVPDAAAVVRALPVRASGRPLGGSVTLRVGEEEVGDGRRALSGPGLEWILDPTLAARDLLFVGSEGGTRVRGLRRLQAPLRAGVAQDLQKVTLLGANLVAGGMVFDDRGAPVRGASVVATLKPSAGAESTLRMRTRSGPDGAFRIEGDSRLGTMDLHISAGGHLAEHRRGLPIGTGGHELRLPRAALLEVSVSLDLGIAAQGLRLRWEAEGAAAGGGPATRFRPRRADELVARASLGRLPIGPGRLVVSAAGEDLLSLPHEARAGRQGIGPLSLEGRLTTHLLRVTDAEGRPLAGARVTPLTATGFAPPVSTDAGGRVRVTSSAASLELLVGTPDHLTARVVLGGEQAVTLQAAHELRIRSARPDLPLDPARFTVNGPSEPKRPADRHRRFQRDEESGDLVAKLPAGGSWQLVDRYAAPKERVRRVRIPATGSLELSAMPRAR